MAPTTSPKSTAQYRALETPETMRFQMCLADRGQRQQFNKATFSCVVRPDRLDNIAVPNSLPVEDLQSTTDVTSQPNQRTEPLCRSKHH